MDSESRRNTYKTWLNTEVGKQNGELYNSCKKALAISEAAARYPESSQEQQRIEAAQKAGEDWELANSPNTESPPIEQKTFSETPQITALEAQKKVDTLFTPQIRRFRTTMIAKRFSAEIDDVLEEKREVLERKKVIDRKT